MSDNPPSRTTGTPSAALVWRLARDFMRPHVRTIVFAFLLMGVAAGGTAFRAWLMQPVLDRIFVARDGSVLMNRVGQRVIADIQIALFARLMRADLAYFHARPAGTLIARFTSDAMLLRNAAANVLGAIGKDAVTVVFLVAVMFYQDWVLALVSF